MIAALFFSFTLHAFSQTFSGSLSTLPWGGYWWSKRNAEIALGWSERKIFTDKEILAIDLCLDQDSANCDALMKRVLKDGARKYPPLLKFDLWVRSEILKQWGTDGFQKKTLFTHASRNELKYHYIGENSAHPEYAFKGYAGKCIGWSLSNVDHTEPTKTRVIDGIEFSPADIKGLLAAQYEGAKYFVKGFGDPYRVGGPEKARKDLSPKQVMGLLEITIDQDSPVQMDLDPSDGVWNHPIYAYEVKIFDRTKTNPDLKIQGQMTLFYALDPITIDAVYSTSKKRKDLTSRTLDFEMTFKGRSTLPKKLSEASSSQWIGDAIDQHPDSATYDLEKNWKTEIYEYRNTAMKTDVNFELLKRTQTSRGQVAWIEVLMGKYFR